EPILRVLLVEAALPGTERAQLVEQARALCGALKADEPRIGEVVLRRSIDPALRPFVQRAEVVARGASLLPFELTQQAPGDGRRLSSGVDNDDVEQLGKERRAVDLVATTRDEQRLQRVVLLGGRHGPAGLLLRNLE